MNERIPEQLDKILAMADSIHEGEAIVAVRKAREMLSRGGLSFGDLARVASKRQSGLKPPGVFSFLSGQRDHLESHIHQLRQQIEELREEMKTQDLELDFWKRRALDLEQNTQHAQNEATRWKDLARSTAERLWDIGQTINAQEFDSKAPTPPTGARAKK